MCIMTNTRFWLCVFVAVSGLNVAHAQDPDLVLRLEPLENPTINVFQVDVRFDNLTAQDWYGWSFGVCHDSSFVQLFGVEDSATTLTVNGGEAPGFSSLEIEDGAGFAVGVVIDIFGVHAIGPGEDYHFNRATYLSGASGMTDLCFCDTVGTPPVSTIIVGSGASVAPTQVCANLTTNGPDPSEPNFMFTVANSQGSYDYFGGHGFLQADLAIEQLLFAGATANPTNGFTLCLEHDPSLLTVANAVPLGPVADLGAGAGPDFFNVEILANGVCVGVVYDATSTQSLSFVAPTSVVRVHYDTVPAAAQQQVNLQTLLLWSNTLSAAGNEVMTTPPAAPPLLIPAEVELLSELRQFRRGDCNADASFNIGDVIHVLGTVFGTIEVPCRQSCEINGDNLIDLADAIALINYLFQGGPSPAAPFPDCLGIFGQDCARPSSCP